MDIVSDPTHIMEERLPFYIIITSYYFSRVLTLGPETAMTNYALSHDNLSFFEHGSAVVQDKTAAAEQRSHHMLMIGLAQLRAPLCEHSECVLHMQESWHMRFPKKVLSQMGSMLHPFSQRLLVPGQLHTVTSALNFSTASDSHAEDECRTKTQTTDMQLNFV